MPARELRLLLPFEIAALVAVAVAPLPEEIPIALPLVAIAAVSLWIRGRALTREPEVAIAPPGRLAAVGAIAGLVALGLGLLAGTPIVEAMLDRAVQWSTYPIVRGSFGQAAVVAIVVVATSAAMELALRGWVVERVLELEPPLSPNVVAIVAGAAAEMLVTRGDLIARFGAGVFGAGLGMMYVASKRSIVTPMCARVVFSLGALALESLQLIG